jgi:hypothetical protein
MGKPQVDEARRQHLDQVDRELREAGL